MGDGGQVSGELTNSLERVVMLKFEVETISWAWLLVGG